MTKRRTLIRFCVIVSTMVLAASKADATTISLAFGTLPSAQGWTYSTSGPSESAAFSVDGSTMLTMDTIGDGQIGANYIRLGEVNSIDPFSVQIELRVPNEEIFAFGPRQGFGFSVLIDDLAYGMLVGPAGLRISDGSGGGSDISFDVDMTSFHTVLFEGTPGVDTYSVSVDGVFATNGVANPTAAASNTIIFGDVSSTGNGYVEVMEYVFTQVPEPSTGLLLSLGLVGLSTRKKLAPNSAI